MDDHLSFGDPGDFDTLFSNADQLSGSLFDTDSLMPDVFGSSPWSPMTTTVSAAASPDLLETFVSGTMSSSVVGNLPVTTDTVVTSSGANGVMKIPIPRASSLEKSGEKPEKPQLLESANWMQNSGGNIIHVQTETQQHQPQVVQKIENQSNLVGRLPPMSENQHNFVNVQLTACGTETSRPSSTMSMTTSTTAPAAQTFQLKGAMLQPAILHQLANNAQLQRLLIQGNRTVSGINLPTLQALQQSQPGLQLVSVQQQQQQPTPQAPGQVQQMTLNTHSGPIAVNTQGGHLVIQRPTAQTATLPTLQVHQATAGQPTYQPTVSQFQAVQIGTTTSVGTSAQLQGLHVNAMTTAPSIVLRTLPGSTAQTQGQNPVVVAQNNTLQLLQGSQLLGSTTNLTNFSVQNQGSEANALQQQQQQGQFVVESQAEHQQHASVALQNQIQLNPSGQSSTAQPQHSITGLQGLNIGNGINNVNIVASEAQVFNNIMLGPNQTTGQSTPLSSTDHSGVTVKIGDQFVNLQGIQNVAQQLQQQQQQLKLQQQLQPKKSMERIVGTNESMTSSGVTLHSTGGSGINNSVLSSSSLVLGRPNVVKMEPVISGNSQQSTPQMLNYQSLAKPTQTLQSLGQPGVQLTQLPGKQQPQQQQQLVQVTVGGGKKLYLTLQQVQLLHKAKQQQQQQQQKLQQESQQLQQIASLPHQQIAPSSQTHILQPHSSASQFTQIQPKLSVTTASAMSAAVLSRNSSQQPVVMAAKSVGSSGGLSAVGNVVTSSVVGGKKGSSMDNLETPSAKKRARGKHGRSQSTISEMPQLSPASSVKSYHNSPASVQSIPPESPTSMQMYPHPASPAGSMGPPSNLQIYLPPSPVAGSLSQRSIVHSIPPPSPAGSLGPPSNLQSNMPPSPSGSMGPPSNPPPSPMGSVVLQGSAVMKSHFPQSPQGAMLQTQQPIKSPQAGAMLQTQQPIRSPQAGAMLQTHQPIQSPQAGAMLQTQQPIKSPQAGAMLQTQRPVQSPQAGAMLQSQQPIQSPVGPVQSLVPPSSATLMAQVNQQLASSLPHSNKLLMMSEHSVATVVTTGSLSSYTQSSLGTHLISLPSSSSGHLPNQQVGLDSILPSPHYEHESALPPDLEQIDLFSPTGENLDIFDSNNDLLDTVGKDLLGNDEQDDVTLSLSLTDPSLTQTILRNDNTSAVYAMQSASNNKTVAKQPDSSSQDDVLQYYLKQLKEQSSHTQEALEQSIQEMIRQKDAVARTNSQERIGMSQHVQEGLEINPLEQQQQRLQQSALTKLGLSGTGVSSTIQRNSGTSSFIGDVSAVANRQEVLQTQEERLKHVQILAKRQRVLQAQALARQQQHPNPSVSSGQPVNMDANSKTKTNFGLSGLQQTLLTNMIKQDARTSIYGSTSMSVVTPTIAAQFSGESQSGLQKLGIKQTRSLSDTTASHLQREYTSQNTRRMSVDEQGGSLHKLQQLLEGESSSPEQNTPSTLTTVSGLYSSTSTSSTDNTMPGLNTQRNMQVVTPVGAVTSVPPLGGTAFSTLTSTPSVIATPGPSSVRVGAKPPQVNQLQTALAQIQKQASQQGLSQEQVLSALKVALKEDGQQNFLQKLLAHNLPVAAHSQSGNDSSRTETSQVMSTSAVEGNAVGSLSDLPQNQSLQMTPAIAAEGVSAQLMAGGVPGVVTGASVTGGSVTGGSNIGTMLDGSPIKRTPVIFLNPKHEELLKRIQEHIRILHRTTNRTSQQNDFMKQLMDGEKRILRFGRIEALKLQNAKLKNNLLNQGNSQSQLSTQQIPNNSIVSSPLIRPQSIGTALVTSSLVTPQSSGLVTTVTTQSITKPLTLTDMITANSPQMSSSLQQNAVHSSQQSAATLPLVAQALANRHQSVEYMNNTAMMSTVQGPPVSNAPVPETLKGLLADDSTHSTFGNSTLLSTTSVTPSIRPTATPNLRIKSPHGVVSQQNVGQNLQLGPAVVTAAAGISGSNLGVVPGTSGRPGVTGAGAAEVSAEMAKQKVENLMQLLAPPVKQQLRTKLSQMNPAEQQAFYKQQASLLMKIQKMQQLKAQQQQQTTNVPTQPQIHVSNQQKPSQSTQQPVLQIDRPLPNASLVKQLMQTDSQIDSTDQLDGTSRYSGPRTSVQQSVHGIPSDVKAHTSLATAPVSSSHVLVGRSSLQSVQLPPSKSSLHMLTRPQLFQLQLKKDQQGALKPDATSPFKNYKDAIKRLIKYHVWQEREDSTKHVETADCEYNEYSGRVLGVMDRMMNKYQQLLFNESLRDSPSAEVVMVERMFLAEERQQYERDKLMAQQHPELFKPTPYIAPPVRPESLSESFSDESECNLSRQDSLNAYNDVKDCKVVLSPLPAGAHYDSIKIKSEPTEIKQETVDSNSAGVKVKTEIEVKTEVVIKSEFQKNETEEGGIPSVPSPSYTVQTSGQGGLKMVFKSSPSHSPCPSPAPSVSLVDETVNQFSDISDIEDGKAESPEVIDRKRPRLDCDNNNLLQVKPSTGHTSSFANQYEEFLRRQNVKEPNKEEGDQCSGAISPPFSGYTPTPLATAPQKHPTPDHQTLRSLGFDTMTTPHPLSSPGNMKMSPPETSPQQQQKFKGCTTLASLLMGSDSDSESQSVVVSSSHDTHQAATQEEPIEIDLTLSPATSPETQGNTSATMQIDGGEKAEMQNAIESILSLERDWQL